MSEQENRDTLERYLQALVRRDLDSMADLVHDDYVEEYRSRAKGSTASKMRVAFLRTIPAACRTCSITATCSAET